LALRVVCERSDWFFRDEHFEGGPACCGAVLNDLAKFTFKEIMRQVNEFVGGAPQSDDLIVIVISVRQEQSLQAG
jgi:hypothetical protein